MGFFECINNQEAASLLFDTAREWLKGAGAWRPWTDPLISERLINTGDCWWMALPIPPTRSPTIFPITRSLFETYGFQTYFKQEGFHLDVTEPLPPRFQKIAEWVSRKPDYEFRHFEWKKHGQICAGFCDRF